MYYFWLGNEDPEKKPKWYSLEEMGYTAAYVRKNAPSINMFYGYEIYF